ncbi:hypothetical protein FB451DRAFT_1205877 [Mycena latifolia]|nr:hypothetical protein FB451DRAFT_1205877 [Mycena latifolia]
MHFTNLITLAVLSAASLAAAAASDSFSRPQSHLANSVGPGTIYRGTVRQSQRNVPPTPVPPTEHCGSGCSCRRTGDFPVGNCRARSYGLY